MTDTDRDEFTFLTHTWDVTAAVALADGLEARSFVVASAAHLLPLIRVDREYAAGADLSVPLVVVPFRLAPGQVSPLVIDGWHRLWRAQAEGVSHLPCKVLTQAQEKQVRLEGGSRGRPDARAARRAALARERYGR